MAETVDRVRQAQQDLLEDVPMVPPPAASDEEHANIVLGALRPVVHTIAKAFGRNCEVLLHDFRNPSASVIEIAGNLTDRGVGAPVNEINQWLLSHGQDVCTRTEKFIRTAKGRTLKNATTIFRGRDGKAFGALCINIDVTEMLAVARGIADLAGVSDLAPEPVNLNDDIAYVIQAVIASEETRLGRRLNPALRADRLCIFRALQEHGVFTLKRAVPRVAEYFGISRATIYGYLNETGADARA